MKIDKLRAKKIEELK